MKQLSCLRRLFAESCAVIASDIKGQVEASDDQPVKRLAPADRAQRLADQRKRLAGLNLRGHLVPEDALVDKSIHIYESDHQAYQEWSSCISRE